MDVNTGRNLTAQLLGFVKGIMEHLHFFMGKYFLEWKTIILYMEK